MCKLFLTKYFKQELQYYGIAKYCNYYNFVIILLFLPKCKDHLQFFKRNDIFFNLVILSKKVLIYEKELI